MMAVVVRPKGFMLRRLTYDASQLMCVDVSYYTSNGTLSLLATTEMLVPKDTNLEALEHMLSLWSLQSNEKECPTA